MGTLCRPVLGNTNLAAPGAPKTLSDSRSVPRFGGPVCWVVLALLAYWNGGSQAQGHSPSSPVVRQMVNRATQYLKESYATQGLDIRVGGACLLGLTMLKTGNANHPAVAEAVAVCKALATNSEGVLTYHKADMYSVGLALIFLCEQDSQANQDTIRFYLNVLRNRQQPHGGWGYELSETGDTSMTQYGAMALWEAENHGIPPDPRMTSAMGQWLLGTQDPAGGWGYQGQYSANERLSQTQVTECMSTAGIASLCVFADLAGVSLASDAKEFSGLPSVVRAVKEARATLTADRGKIVEAVKRNDDWMAKNWRIDPGEYQHYYMYALERYQSFRALASGQPILEGDWYNQGVELLRKTQGPDGSWNSRCGAELDTCFAVLFLVRSTKGTIAKVRNFKGGVLKGGRGLNAAEVAQTTITDGVQRKLTGQGESVLNMLRDPADPETFYFSENLDELDALLPQELEAAEQQALALQLGDANVSLRLIAVRALGRGGNMDVVPRLIYALSDPDKRVVIEANDALRKLGRIVVGYELPDWEVAENREKHVRKWKDWYRGIRPDAVLED